MKKKRKLTKTEHEEKRIFEMQKKALEERAERLRNMSFDVKASDDDTNNMENVPAYVRNNIVLETGLQSLFIQNQKYHIEYRYSKNSLNLYFDLSETSKDEISNTILLLSELYTDVGGDKLIIKKSEILALISEPETELI